QAVAERHRRYQIGRRDEVVRTGGERSDALQQPTEGLEPGGDREPRDGERVDDVLTEASQLAVAPAERGGVEGDGVRGCERGNALHPPEVDARITDMGVLPVDHAHFACGI